MDMRELLSFYNFDGDNTPIIRGSALGALIGGMYAAGKLPEVKQWMFKLDRRKVLSLVDFSLSLNHLVKGNRVMDALNEKLLLKPENRVENQSDLAKLNAAVERDREAAAARSGNVQRVSLKLYSVKDGRIAEPVRRSFVSRLKEDNMAEAVKSVLVLSGVPGVDKISVLHVFRSAETASTTAHTVNWSHASHSTQMSTPRRASTLTAPVRTAMPV